MADQRQSFLNFCRDFPADSACQAPQAVVQQPAVPAVPPVPVGGLSLGLPWPLLVAAPVVVVFAALQHLTKDETPYRVPTVAFEGIADLPRYQPPVLPRSYQEPCMAGDADGPITAEFVSGGTAPDCRHEMPDYHQAFAIGGGMGATVADQGAETLVPSVVAQHGALSAPFDMAGYLADHLGPTLVTATPRTGKGMILQRFWRLAQQRGCTVWVLQPKPAKQELTYWAGVDQFLPLMLEDYDRDSPAIADQMRDFVMRWRQQRHRPTVLIIDELVKIQACQPQFYDWLKSQVLVEMSSGETDQRYLYLVSQSPLVGDIGLSGGNRAILNLVALARRDKPEHLRSLRRSMGSVPEPDSNLFGRSESPNGAIVYHSNLGNWYPMPEYQVPKADPLATDFLSWYQERTSQGKTVTVQDFQNASRFKRYDRSQSTYERLITSVSPSVVSSSLN